MTGECLTTVAYPAPSARLTSGDGTDRALRDAAPAPALREDARVLPFHGGGAAQPVMLAVGGRHFALRADAGHVAAALAERPRTFSALAARAGALSDGSLTADDVAAIVRHGIPPIALDGSTNERAPTRGADIRGPAIRRAGAGDTPPRTPFLVGRDLVPARFSAIVARPLAALVDRRLAASAALVGAPLAAVALLATEAPTRPLGDAASVAALAAIAASMLAHELGHVAACRRYGAPVGSIGAGIYVCFPVLYADVAASWTLPRRHRIAVAAGGFYFQLLLVLACTAAACALHAAGGADLRAAVRWLAAANAVSIVHMCNPALKLDGYWIASDALGIPNLHRRLGEFLRAAVRGEPMPPALAGAGRARLVALASLAGLTGAYWLGFLLALSAATPPAAAHAARALASLARAPGAGTAVWVTAAASAARSMLVVAGWVFAVTCAARLAKHVASRSRGALGTITGAVR